MPFNFQCKKLAGPKGKILVDRPIELDLQSPDWVSLIGRNGVGKTTLLNELAIYLGGNCLYLPQEKAALAEASVKDNILLYERLYENDGDIDDTALQRHLKALYAPIDLAVLFKNLSGGEQQRVLLARAFLSQQSYVLLDEPFAAIDPMDRQLVMSSCKKHFAGLCVYHSTHDPLLALQYADRVLHLTPQGLIEIPLPGWCGLSHGRLGIPYRSFGVVESLYNDLTTIRHVL